MVFTLGIRREDKNKWERRVPIIPKHIRELKDKYCIETIIQPSPIRAFSKKDYKNAGAKINEDLSQVPVVFAIKEIPLDFFQPGKTYMFFAHVIKGQKYNMPMLKRMMKLGCNLIDYEKIADEKGRRLVFFGRFAGLAGMIDALWAYGQRMKSKGIDTPLSQVKQTINYFDLEEVKQNLKQIGKQIKKDGFPDSISPFVVGFAGYGNVSRGAQEIINVLPVEKVLPDELEFLYEDYSDDVIYKVVFKEKHMVKPKNYEKHFDLQEYYTKPELYQGIFSHYVPYLSILMNCIYWENRYPRLFTKDFLKKNYSDKMKLQVIGDISVDINGAIEFTEKTTTPGNPVFVYNPEKDDVIDDYNGEGVAVIAVDNLPCELPRESSKAFSDTLIQFIPPIVEADFSVDFQDLSLPPEIKKAVILHHGNFTPEYQYINKYL